MNRRGFFQTIVIAIASALALFKKTKADSIEGKVWVVFSYDSEAGFMTCPFCDKTVALIEEGGFYPMTLYCKKCKIGFNKIEKPIETDLALELFQKGLLGNPADKTVQKKLVEVMGIRSVREVDTRIEVEYAYES